MGNAIARFKELCLDTTARSGVVTTDVSRFWAAATGCEQKFFGTPGDPGDPGDVVGADEGMGIAICPVPDPKTVKNRVHLDLHAASADDLVALGATVDPVQHEEDPWTLMLDPEGNEFCAFLREPEKVPAYKVYELVVDSTDFGAIGDWWADVFGVEVQRQEGKDWVWLEGVPGTPFEAWVFGAVPEPKTVKNRMHWDVYGDVADFEARGATRLWDMPRWTVLADPEGNEFCVFPEG